MKKLIYPFFLNVFLSVLCFNTFAQTTAFTYQGRLTDAGNAAAGIYDLQFDLYDALSGGAQVGTTQTVSGVTVTNGIFTVQLDFGASAFPGADRYLEIRVKKPVEGSYTTLNPRQPVTSVPYSVRSLNATNVETTTAGNSVVSSINNAATNVTINTDRLSSDVVRLTPPVTQSQTTNDPSLPLLDVSGGYDDGNNFIGTSRLRLNVDGGFFTSQTGNTAQSFGSVPTTGAGSRMMWYPGKYAFRAGRVDSFGSTYWDNANIGTGSIALGYNTRASGNNSFAANLATTASGNESVALGNNGTSSADRSFSFNGTASGVGAIALGSGAQATSDDALALGPSSIAGGLASVTIGPSIANGSFAVAIGLQNKAMGNFSLALGKNASTCSVYNCTPGTEKQGSIVISDGCAGFSTDAVTATANNQVNIRGCGGFRFFTNQGLTSGVELAPGGGSWLTLSDRNMKENFTAVNSRDVLQKVLNLPISTWNYKSQDKSIRHIGAMAQDFYKLFGVGEDDKRIATIDPDGVAFAAIQGLSEELKDRDRKIADQQKQLQEQDQRLNTVQEQLKQQQLVIDSLKKLLCANNPAAEVCK